MYEGDDSVQGTQDLAMVVLQVNLIPIIMCSPCPRDKRQETMHICDVTCCVDQLPSLSTVLSFVLCLYRVGGRVCIGRCPTQKTWGEK